MVEDDSEDGGEGDGDDDVTVLVTQVLGRFVVVALTLVLVKGAREIECGTEKVERLD